MFQGKSFSCTPKDVYELTKRWATLEKDEGISVTRNSMYKGPEAGRSIAHVGRPEKSQDCWNRLIRSRGTRIRLG